MIKTNHKQSIYYLKKNGLCCISLINLPSSYFAANGDSDWSLIKYIWKFGQTKSRLISLWWLDTALTHVSKLRWRHIVSNWYRVKHMRAMLVKINRLPKYLRGVPISCQYYAYRSYLSGFTTIDYSLSTICLMSPISTLTTKWVRWWFNWMISNIAIDVKFNSVLIRIQFLHRPLPM